MSGRGSAQTFTGAVAEFVSTAEVTGCASALLLDRARKGLVDTLGVMVAGSAAPVRPTLAPMVTARSVSGSAGRSVLGTGWRSYPELAALVNGTFGHALDYDDVAAMMPGHPSVVVVAALLADPPLSSPNADPEMSAPGWDRLLDAYIVGVEVASRVGQSIGIGHYHHGWHTTSTMGIFGAVAALGHLRRSSADDVSRAIGIASSMASGLRANFGTMSKPFHSGWAACSGYLAVEMASHGFDAMLDGLAVPGGVFDVYGEGPADLAVVDMLGKPYVLEEPGLGLKRYPCAYASHRGIDAIRAIRQNHHVSPDTVEQVRCAVPPGGLRTLIHPEPTTGLEAKFSMPYVLARGVLNGEFTLAAFTDAAVRDEQVRALLPRIVVVEDDACWPANTRASGPQNPGSRGFVEVTVRFTDGSRQTSQVWRPLGAPGTDVSWDVVRDKFIDCCLYAGMAPAAAAAAFDLLAAGAPGGYAAAVEVLADAGSIA